MQFKFRRLSSVIEWGSLVLSTAIVCFFLFVILWEIFSKGASELSWDFISSVPSEGMTKGGIITPILGTVLLTLITAIFSIPFGICCAIYLNEYAENNWVTRIIRASIRNLSGVPSIIYGLFGLALFVQVTGPAAIVIGNEGDGMSQLVRKNCDVMVHIPMKGKISSLNASAAASILLYEAVRQRLI